MYPIEKISTNIYSQIEKIVIAEEQILKPLNKGIFFMPELALSYKVGLSLIQNQKEIIGNDGWDAEREMKLHAAGPTDLILKNESSDKDIIFEFKVRGKYKGPNSYFADIEKLHKHPSDKYIKYFCALVDAFENANQNDGRIIEVNKKYKDLIAWKPDQFHYFKTIEHLYEKQIVCVVALWQIN